MGWSVSQTERLVGLPRRDIQRSCYHGQGGVGLVTPQTSTWGYRVYEEEQLALLFLIACEKHQGKSLPEASQDISAARAAGKDIVTLLTNQADRLADTYIELKGQLIRAQALTAALSPSTRALQLERLVDRSMREAFEATSNEYVAATATQHDQTDGSSLSLANRLATVAYISLSEGPEAAADEARKLAQLVSAAAKLDIADASEALLVALESPGLDLAIELWLGQGSYLLIQTAFETQATQFPQ